MMHELNIKCKLLRSRSDSTKSCETGKCIFCIHIEDLKRSLLKYMKIMMQETKRAPKTLSKTKLQNPVVKADSQLHKQEIKHLAKAVLNSIAKNRTSSPGKKCAISTSNIKQQSANNETVPGYSHENTRHLGKTIFHEDNSTEHLNYSGKRLHPSSEKAQVAKHFKSSSILSEKENKGADNKDRQKEADITVGPESGSLKTLLQLSVCKHQTVFSKVSSDDIKSSKAKLLAAETQNSTPSKSNGYGYQDKARSHVGHQLFVIPETQDYDYLSNLDGTCPFRSKDETQQQLLVPETQDVGYLHRSDCGSSVEDSRYGIKQNLVVPETLTMGYLSKPASPTEQMNKKHDQLVSDIQEEQCTGDLSMLDVDIDNGMDKRILNVYHQESYIPKLQTQDSLDDIIYISDKDDDTEVNQEISQLEDISLDKNTESTLNVSFLMTDFSTKCSRNNSQPSSHNVSITNIRPNETGESTIDICRDVNFDNFSVTEESLSQTSLDSFDIVPKPAQHEVPHVSVVRKRQERNKLKGYSCQLCYKYYQGCGLSEKALKKKMNNCSRHRGQYQAPNTPQHFWSLGFPDTAEMNERMRGKYPADSSKISEVGPRRQKPLEKKF